MEITSAMAAFLEQERRMITENIRRTGVHLTYVSAEAAEGDQPACACCRSAVLNGAAHRVLERGSDLTPGEQVDVAGRTVLVEELPMSGMVLFAADDYYDRPPWEPIAAFQLTWADAAGRFPWDEGHAPGRWRQPPASGWRG